MSNKHDEKDRLTGGGCSGGRPLEALALYQSVLRSLNTSWYERVTTPGAAQVADDDLVVTQEVVQDYILVAGDVAHGE